MNEPEANAPPTDLGDTTKSTTTMEPQVEKPNTSAVRPPVKSRSSMNGPLYMQTSKNKVLVRRVKRKDEGPMRALARWFLENQTGMFIFLYFIFFLPAKSIIPLFSTHSHATECVGIYLVLRSTTAAWRC